MRAMPGVEGACGVGEAASRVGPATPPELTPAPDSGRGPGLGAGPGPVAGPELGAGPDIGAGPGSHSAPDAAPNAALAPAEGLGRAAVALLAAACGIAVANANYAQPLLLEISRSLRMTDAAVGLVPALTQAGVAAGVLLLLPLGDVVPVRRLLTVAICVQVAALAAMALAPSGPLLIAGAFAVGLFGITPYVLPPYATLHTPARRRGHVTALLAQGVIVGMLLARAVSGFVGLHLGWRAVYGMAAVLMLALLGPIRRVIRRAPAAGRIAWPGAGPIAYPALMRSLWRVAREEPALRRSALCQAFNWGSFNVLWIGLTFHMQSPAFGWRSDGIGALALVGAASAAAAPFVGRIADRKGPRRSLLLALSATVLGWVVLTLFGSAVSGVLAGLILLDVGTTAADISNRTIIFGLRPTTRTRVATVYMVSMFGGGAIMAWLTGVVWSAGGWPWVCALGAGSAAMSGLLAWRGIGRGPALPSG